MIGFVCFLLLAVVDISFVHFFSFLNLCFFQVTTLGENPQVLPLISRMVPRVNLRFFIGQCQINNRVLKSFQQFTHNELNMSLTGIEPGWGG
jgi:hypothetical protein